MSHELNRVVVFVHTTCSRNYLVNERGSIKFGIRVMTCLIFIDPENKGVFTKDSLRDGFSCCVYLVYIPFYSSRTLALVHFPLPGKRGHFRSSIKSLMKPLSLQFSRPRSKIVMIN